MASYFWHLLWSLVSEWAVRTLLAEGLAALALSGSNLERLLKGAPEKTVLAWWLRAQTTVTLRWIGQRLKMGHYTRVTQVMSRMQHKQVRKRKKNETMSFKTE